MDYDHMIGIVEMMEEKLIELMGDDAYTEWSQKAMKKLFRLEIDNMADSDFKRFCQDNFDEIVSDEPMSGLYYWEDEDALGGTEDEA